MSSRILRDQLRNMTSQDLTNFIMAQRTMLNNHLLNIEAVNEQEQRMVTDLEQGLIPPTLRTRQRQMIQATRSRYHLYMQWYTQDSLDYNMAEAEHERRMRLPRPTRLAFNRNNPNNDSDETPMYQAGQYAPSA